jgi:hypothetical protein
LDGFSYLLRKRNVVDNVRNKVSEYGISLYTDMDTLGFKGFGQLFPKMGLALNGYG